MTKTTRAFAMMEIGIVVAIVGLLAFLVVPRFASAGEDERVKQAAVDLGEIAKGFNIFRRSNGYWPPETNPGQMPPEMRSAFPGGNPFAGACPIGGVYDYDNAKDESAVIIAIKNAPGSPAPSMSEAQQLDALIDDGDLRTGNFRAVDGGYAYAFSRK
jgi:type II secretory pathway pseudopilin PulG